MLLHYVFYPIHVGSHFLFFLYQLGTYKNIGIGSRVFSTSAQLNLQPKGVTSLLHIWEAQDMNESLSPYDEVAHGLLNIEKQMLFGLGKTTGLCKWVLQDEVC